MDRKYAIFGCTADPFTPAHRAIIKAALEQPLGIEKVFIIPTVVNYYRGNKLPWLNDREKMQVIDVMMEGIDGEKWEVWDKELRLKYFCLKSSRLSDRLSKNHRFIDTLIDFRLEHPECEKLYIIIGADQAVNFKDWTEYREILNLSELLVVPSSARHDYDIPAWLNYKILRIDREFDDMSASYFREKYRNFGVDAYLDSIVKPITREKQLLHTPIFDVVAAPATEDGFRPIKVKAPDWVTIVVTDSVQNKVLVERQFRYGANREIAEFPCGTVEPDENSAVAAVRELEEETGIRLLSPETQLIPLGVTNPNPAFMTNKMYYYWVDMAYAEFVQVDRKLDEHENINVEWTNMYAFFNEVLANARNGEHETPAILLSAIHLYNNRKIPLSELDAEMPIMSDSLYFGRPREPGKLR